MTGRLRECVLRAMVSRASACGAAVCALLAGGCERVSGPPSPLRPITIPTLTIEAVLDEGVAFLSPDALMNTSQSACMNGYWFNNAGERLDGIRNVILALELPDTSLLRVRTVIDAHRNGHVDLRRNWRYGTALFVRWDPFLDQVLYTRYQTTPRGVVGVEDTIPLPGIRDRLVRLQEAVAVLSCPPSLIRDFDIAQYLPGPRQPNDTLRWTTQWGPGRPFQR